MAQTRNQSSMEKIQLAIADRSYAAALRQMLVRDGTWEVLSVESPDPTQAGVMVLDPDSLASLPAALANPERVVLITQNDPQQLSRAWDAGIVSVVFDNDPLNTAMLAIMAARLRVAKDVRRGPLSCSPPAGEGEEVSNRGPEGKPAPGSQGF